MEEQRIDEDQKTVGAEQQVDEGAAHEEATGSPASGEGENGFQSAANDLAVLQAELEALNDRHLRLAAEFDNYRKRIDRERAEFRVRAQAEIVERLLEVLDDLQRVSEYSLENVTAEALLEGMQLVEKKMRHVLESAGLEPIDPKGEYFNPTTMEALMTVPAEHPEEDEVVVDVFQKGYRYGNVLIRPARVRVKKYEG